MLTNLIKRLTRVPVGYRTFTTGLPAFTAQKSPLFQLRQKTGLAYNLCREALDKHDNDLNQAEIWLQAQALAHGLQKATKVSSRTTKEGLISLAVCRDNKSVTLLELNCETDFVAKNQIFRDFTVDLTEEIANSKDGFNVHQSHSNSSIEESIAGMDKLNGLSNKIAPLLTRLGENIRIHKVVHFKSTCSRTNLYGQIHAQAGQRKSDNFDTIAGRFGAIVALRLNSDSNIPSRAVGNRLCHHVIGYSPTYIELPEELRKSLEEAEKEKEKAQEQVQPTPDAEEEEDRDMDELHLGSSSSSGSRDDWPSIMDQQLIMSDEQSVRDFCEENQVSIVYFKRLECGIET